MRRQYRRLTPGEKDYLVCNYADDANAIALLAASLNLSPKQLRGHARYLNLTARSDRHSWTPAELELLDDWAETKPLHIFVACWNRLASQQGRPMRSLRAIEKKLLERGHSTIAQINYYSAPAVARLLNRSESWVKRLIENGKLIARKDGVNWKIKAKHLRKFIFTYPYDSTARLSPSQFADLLLAIDD